MKPSASREINKKIAELQPLDQTEIYHWQREYKLKQKYNALFISPVFTGRVLSSIFWVHPVQASDDDVSVTAWSRPTVLVRRPTSLGGYPVAATSAFRLFAAGRRAAHSSSDCWRPSVRWCRSDALEQSATRHYWLCVTDIILPEMHFFVFCIISMTTCKAAYNMIALSIYRRNYQMIQIYFECCRWSFCVGVIRTIAEQTH